MSGLISQKCLYGLKAVFDLAANRSEIPVKIGAIAARRNIPVRFLEAILRQLRQGGFVESRRGAEGGYLLAKDPRDIRVGEIVRFFERDFAGEPDAPPNEDASDVAGVVLDEIFARGLSALMEVLDGITLADLLEQSESVKANYITNFHI